MTKPSGINIILELIVAECISPLTFHGQAVADRDMTFCIPRQDFL